jgi:hypothetical protein
MSYQPLTDIIFDNWEKVCQYIADGHANEFTGRSKETLVFRRLKREIVQDWPSVRLIGPDRQATFGDWRIDLVCIRGRERVALEGKFKILSDGAVPDNRKAALFDLFKLERYVSSREYSEGLFVWLTNKPQYLKIASGDSSDFSTHQGRIYEPETRLDARRARDSHMPLPLKLIGRYEFSWKEVLPNAGWYSLVLKVS